MDTCLHSGAQALTGGQWQELYGADRADLSLGYARLREHMKPGDPLLLTAADDSGVCLALHGALTTPASGLFSHPWKLLTSEQLRRPEEGDAERVGEDHADALRAVTGGTDGSVPDAAALTAVLGEAMVFRSFDSSEAGLRADLDGQERQHALRALLKHAQQAVRDGAAGAICVPFVRADDETLRTALARCGFRGAVLTAVTAFDLRGVSSYEEYLAGLPSRRRRLHRKEEQALTDSGLRLDSWSLAGHVNRIAALEARNIAKHGGQPNPQALVAARTTMAALLGDRIRVPVALDETGEPAACGIHMTDGQNYCILMYGADASVSEGVPVYPCLTFYEPLRHAARHGLRTVRLGFEAYSAKLRRGARLRYRPTFRAAPGDGVPRRPYVNTPGTSHRSAALTEKEVEPDHGGAPRPM
ncbi:GNAT family N-acetyltransferase [Streptomyces regalis]|uniref:BioF2-like acetyltransferase domain-containing protein n=1 Tax=Streptomyces regalis TaxID=68262 RepID=A0A101JTK4_9ACTN|nr:GNAT family N-acetyltransferase [Streptomyces regalis]KUL32181.1 hypothetical protein ADL12_23625 [Streptomyces regalis]